MNKEISCFKCSSFEICSISNGIIDLIDGTFNDEQQIKVSETVAKNCIYFKKE